MYAQRMRFGSTQNACKPSLPNPWPAGAAAAQAKIEPHTNRIHGGRRVFLVQSSQRQLAPPLVCKLQRCCAPR